MKVMMIIMALLSAIAVNANEYTAENCEVHIDKVASIKVYFHDRADTYTKLEVYLKVRSDLTDQVTNAEFYAQEQINHAYGQTKRPFRKFNMEKVAGDYYKISLEVWKIDHHVSKYSNRRSYTGNFYIDLNNGDRIWTKLEEHNGSINAVLSTQEVYALPYAPVWLNDGPYYLDAYSQTAEYSYGFLHRLNPNRCR